MKKTVLALSLGLLIGSAGTAVAASTDTVQAVFAKFNFVVNGQAKQLAADPLVVDGTSYLPVRAMADLLGYRLNYDDATRTIKLDGSTTEPVKGEDTVTKNVNEWIPLRDLVDQYGLKITTNSTSMLIENANVSVTIEYIFVNNEIVGGKTKSGSFGLKIENSVTLLKEDDLRTVGLIN